MNIYKINRVSKMRLSDVFAFSELDVSVVSGNVLVQLSAIVSFILDLIVKVVDCFKGLVLLDLVLKPLKLFFVYFSIDLHQLSVQLLILLVFVCV